MFSRCVCVCEPVMTRICVLVTCNVTGYSDRWPVLCVCVCVCVCVCTLQVVMTTLTLFGRWRHKFQFVCVCIWSPVRENPKPGCWWKTPWSCIHMEMSTSLRVHPNFQNKSRQIDCSALCLNSFSVDSTAGGFQSTNKEKVWGAQVGYKKQWTPVKRAPPRKTGEKKKKKKKKKSGLEGLHQVSLVKGWNSTDWERRVPSCKSCRS